MERTVEIKKAARRLAPELATRAAEGEMLRTMPPDLVAALRRDGLFRIAVPQSLGGLELDPVSIIEVVEEISWADGSAGWTTLIGNSVAFFAWLDPSVVASIPTGDIVSTGVFAPLGRARRTGDGDHLVLDGRWSFNSGCVHADWFQVGFLVMDDDQPATRPDGRLDWRFAYIPAAQAEVIDTWRSMGLRGTGSHDLAVTALVIPEAHTAMPMFDPPRHESRLLGLGFRALTAALLAGFPLGVARRALDEVEATAPLKRRWSRDTTIADDRVAQLEIGRAEGALRSARAFTVECFADAWRSIGDDGLASAEQRSRMLLALQQCMAAALEAVTAAYRLTGASAVYEDHPIGRCFRDLHVARQHIVFSGDWFAEFAQECMSIPGSTVDAAVAGDGA
jgi:alkylation response protein AidB-like acyl-CoA dehydrogenase